jgi:hypothetical protein
MRELFFYFNSFAQKKRKRNKEKETFEKVKKNFNLKRKPRVLYDNGWVIYERFPQHTHTFFSLFLLSAVYCRVKFHKITCNFAKDGSINEKLLKYWTCVKFPNLDCSFLCFFLCALLNVLLSPLSSRSLYVCMLLLSSSLIVVCSLVSLCIVSFSGLFFYPLACSSSFLARSFWCVALLAAKSSLLRQHHVLFCFIDFHKIKIYSKREWEREYFYVYFKRR